MFFFISSKWKLRLWLALTFSGCIKRQYLVMLSFLKFVTKMNNKTMTTTWRSPPSSMENASGNLLSSLRFCGCSCCFCLIFFFLLPLNGNFYHLVPLPIVEMMSFSKSFFFSFFFSALGNGSLFCHRVKGRRKGICLPLLLIF